jgi:hypothetical protein
MTQHHSSGSGASLAVPQQDRSTGPPDTLGGCVGASPASIAQLSATDTPSQDQI